MGFFIVNTLASALGLTAAAAAYYLLPSLDQTGIAIIGASGYLGCHLPKVQQPTLPSYRIIRLASWLAALMIPLTAFLYRPTDLILAWLMAAIFTTSMWIIIDRISLRRDYTHSLTAIWLLPLAITGYAYLAQGQMIVLPVFLASSAGYLGHLLLEHLLRQDFKLPDQQKQ